MKIYLLPSFTEHYCILKTNLNSIYIKLGVSKIYDINNYDTTRETPAFGDGKRKKEKTIWGVCGAP